METLRGTMRRAMLEGFQRLPDWRAERDHLIGEHEQVISYVEAGDAAGAGSALRHHVKRFYAHVMDPAPADSP
jgi:DNA-binding GntR family transcriptional regulator